eukprot:665498-Hanusia_phi.AAC.1
MSPLPSSIPTVRQTFDWFDLSLQLKHRPAPAPGPRGPGARPTRSSRPGPAPPPAGRRRSCQDS